MAPADAETATPFLPERLSMRALREAAAGCRGCPLHEDATQTVFGRGPGHAEVMMVGEQPGDREDLEGRPFVGPAGRVLNEALDRVGIDRSDVYVTNAVKHFKFTRRGKRRLHQRPGAMEVNACAPWLEAELAVVKPSLLVALGATAARAVYGTKVKVMRDRGTLIESAHAPLATVTIHPSALLRIDDPSEKKLAHAEFERDLAQAYERLSAA
jgi:uracil-DNA glycosylase